MNVVSTLAFATALPESILGTRWFAVLSTFVAINTILYVSMSIFKILPKPYLSDIVRRHGRRAETRSIYPDGHSASDEDQRHSGDDLALLRGVDANSAIPPVPLRSLDRTPA